MRVKKGNRKQLILEALARELQAHPGGRITTAALARAVGVTEAALYRHFPSKARMFEGLITFAEDSLFSRINQIMTEERNTVSRCQLMLYLLLGFAEQNPGIVRVMLGQAVVGEHERLQGRTRALFDRLDAQFRQLLRETRIREDAQLRASPELTASFLVTYIQGRMQEFLRTRFEQAPGRAWESDWLIVRNGIFIS